MNEVLNISLHIILLEKPACLKMILASPWMVQLIFYLSVRRKTEPPSF